MIHLYSRSFEFGEIVVCVLLERLQGGVVDDEIDLRPVLRRLRDVDGSAYRQARPGSRFSESFGSKPLWMQTLVIPAFTALS